MKHKLKLAAREFYARVLFHTGLHAVVNAVMPRRLTILAGHCVSPSPSSEHLPSEMKIDVHALESILAWFKARYDVCTIGTGVEKLRQGGGKSLVALSMDDGYRDNHRVMQPMLQKLGVGATVFLESRALDERRVNWSHKFFWILTKLSIAEFIHRYGELCEDERSYHVANQYVTEGREDPVYQFKRLLKYETDPHDRDRVIDLIFAEQGGDETRLADLLYVTWEEARAMQAAGIELGGHTVSHAILSKLEPAEAEREIREGRESLKNNLGSEIPTFAYPWGRRWDFNEAAEAAVTRAGFRTAVTMHAGTNRPDTPPTRLHRLAIDENAKLHLLVAEACGGFALAAKFGLKLSE
ncbi:MAG: polysaccharide deacetylase family protein [Planctomycetes bacterium]|nr:polysaccharide deacetylase family protein [Planctomycetota bacterium]